jgi:hypothetical protein
MFNCTGRETMPYNGHAAYRSFVEEWIKNHAADADVVERLRRRAQELLVLLHLDLEPARPVLQACYAANPRGGDPWDPVVVLRSLLLAALVGQPSLNKWADDLAGDRVLRILAGITEEQGRPGVGTLYDFLHRLHNGPVRKACEHTQPPADTERRQARTPRKLKRKKPVVKRPGKRGRKKKGAEPAAPPEPELGSVTERLVQELDAARSHGVANDLVARLGAILLEVGVKESATRGLLGNLDQLLIAGDGSSLKTGANRHGKKACGHPITEKCDCPRFYSDPAAEWGWDSHREVWFFGHRFYEISTSVGGHDLPLGIDLAPGNVSDFVLSLTTAERTAKLMAALAPHMHTARFIADAGHDGEAIHRYFRSRGIAPVIPLKADAPAGHPSRPDIRLSPRGVPICTAGTEMAPWGTAGHDRLVFLCPVRAGKLDRCPLAPPDQPEWRCRPDLQCGPSLSISIEDNPRLFPRVSRNSREYETLYNLRSGCERSNSMKKESFKLEAARHRRPSFWLIRLHLIALLQHARVWVDEIAADAFLDGLLAPPPQEVTALAA